MKIYSTIITALILLGSLNLNAQEYFGDKISPEGAITSQAFLKSMQDRDSMDVKVEAKIQAVCQKKGCWMDLDLGNGETMKVRFKDYEFFVPKDADGKTAVIEGRAKRETIDVATLKHYAEDAGQSPEEVAAITKPEKSYSFEAVGVIIK